MREKVKGYVSIRAISGTHVVFLAFDMKENDTDGLMGFAIQRTDLTEKETVWMKGNKTFAKIRPTNCLDDASSYEHPFQAFQWADYSVKPGHEYRYNVIPMYGMPGKLFEGKATKINIESEPLYGEKHDVHFNRGAIASQAFTKRFQGKTLDQAGPAAYEWLARDLLPALIDFIGRAKNKEYSLHAAIYEVQWPAVLNAFKLASQICDKVEIIYHGRNDKTGNENRQSITNAGIVHLCTPRNNAKLMHNKFIVLCKKNIPVSVWTGSTNLSRNALHGQLNVGHAIHDIEIAKAYLNYWQVLKKDLNTDDLRDWSDESNPLPPENNSYSLVPVFSPHHGRSIYDWWLSLANLGEKDVYSPLFMTFPFGISKDFRKVYDKNDNVLRFALLDKYVNGGKKESRAEAIRDIERIRKYPNIGMALGNRIFVDWVDGWYKESAAIGVNVNWVHTKFMLIDPLGSKPVTITGSANWSEASVNVNDENMVVIQGNQRVADIYFSEFMRIFAHHRFRESISRHLKQDNSNSFKTWKPQDLFENPKDWVSKNFKPGSEHYIKRLYFYG